jgi:hypothetical protein
MTAEYFRQEMQRFREVMCSTAYTLDQKEKAFEGLALGYVCLPAGCKNEEMLFESLTDEWARRGAYEVMANLGKRAPREQ